MWHFLALKSQKSQKQVCKINVATMATSPTTEQQKLVAELIAESIAELKDCKELRQDIVDFMKSEPGLYANTLDDQVKKIQEKLRDKQKIFDTTKKQVKRQTQDERSETVVDLFDVLTLLEESERQELLSQLQQLQLPDYDEIKDNSDLAWKVSQLPYLPYNAKDSIPNEIFKHIKTKLNLPATPQRDFVPKRSEPRMLSNFRYLETLQNQEQIAKFVEEQRQTFVEALQQSMDESMYGESGDFPDEYIDFEPIMKRLKYNNEKAYDYLQKIGKALKPFANVADPTKAIKSLNATKTQSGVAAAKARAAAEVAAAAAAPAAGGAKTSKKPKRKTSGTQ